MMPNEGIIRYHSKYSPYIAASGNDNQIVPIRPRSCPARVHKILCGAIRVVAPNELAVAGKVLSFPAIVLSSLVALVFFPNPIENYEDWNWILQLPQDLSIAKKYLKSRPNIWMFARWYLGVSTLPWCTLIWFVAQLTSSWNQTPLHRLKCSHQDPLRAITIQHHWRPKNSPETARSTPANEAAMACAESAVEGSAKIGRPTHSLGGKMITWANPTSSCRKKCPDHPMDVFQHCFFVFWCFFFRWGRFSGL